jgi:hypothetical protein
MGVLAAVNHHQETQNCLDPNITHFSVQRRSKLLQRILHRMQKENKNRP